MMKKRKREVPIEGPKTIPNQSYAAQMKKKSLLYTDDDEFEIDI